MIRKCMKNELDKYIEFAYILAKDLTKSSYPTFCDGIKTKENFVDRLFKSYSSNNEEILVFEFDNKVEGIIHYFWIEEDNCIQTSVFNVDQNSEQALDEFINYLKQKFSGYNLFIGFPKDNIKSINYLIKCGFECIEEDNNNTAFLDKITISQINEKVIKVNKENFSLFKEIHAKYEENMYWTTQRIFEKLYNWNIFCLIDENKVVGAIYYTSANDNNHFEIFGVDLDETNNKHDVFTNLTKAAIFDIKSKGGKFVTFFVDDDFENDALLCGFEKISSYICFKIDI